MEQINFLPLMILLGVALAVPIVTSRIPGGAVPSVVGEILAGIVIGRSGLDLIDESVWLDFLSEFGFAFLMFLSGLEVDFHLVTDLGASGRRALARLLDNPALVGAGLFVFSLAGAFASARFLMPSADTGRTMFLALILSTTSVGIVVPILKERGLSRRPLGQTILMAATAADFMTILLITVVAAMLGGTAGWEPLLVSVLIAAFLAAVALGGRLRRVALVHTLFDQLGHRTAQIGVRGGLALMVFFVVLATSVGAELVLGAFLAGAIISSISREEGSALREKLDAIGYGLFVPIFFVTVGVRFNLRELGGSGDSLWFILGALAAAYAVKVVPALLLAIRYPIRDAAGAGVLLSARLSLIIAAAVVGLRLGVISESRQAAFIVVAIVTSTVSPALFSRLYPRRSQASGRVLIVGGGDTGALLAQRLRSDHVEPVIVERDAGRVAALRAMRLEAFEGDGTSPEVLRQAGAEDAAALVAATRDDDVNLAVCELARDHFETGDLLAAVVDHARSAEYASKGIRVASGPMAIALTLENLIARPDVFGLLAEPGGESEVLEIPLNNRSLTGRSVDRVHLPGDALIVLVRRGGRSFVPHPDTVLEPGDLVTLAGERDSVEEAALLVSTGPRSR